MELQLIQQKIFEIRGYRVMIDFHLAELYEIENRALKQAVRRNMDRFPPDFMFQLTNKEANEMIHIGVSQSVIPPNYNLGSSLPFAFTEQGVAMLSSILKSKKAIEINIGIMRAFVMLRELTTGYAEIKKQLDQFMLDTNLQIADIYDILNEMASKQKQLDKPRNPIGFVIPKK